MILVHLKILISSDLHLILDLHLITYLQYHFVNLLYLVRNSMSFGTKQLRLSIYIFHSMMVILEHVNFWLLDNARVYQTCISNKNYKTGCNNIRIYTILHCLSL